MTTHFFLQILPLFPWVHVSSPQKCTLPALPQQHPTWQALAKGGSRPPVVLPLSQASSGDPDAEGKQTRLRLCSTLRLHQRSGYNLLTESCKNVFPGGRAGRARARRVAGSAVPPGPSGRPPKKKKKNVFPELVYTFPFMCVQHQQRSDAAFKLDQQKTRSSRFWEVAHVEIVSDGGIKLNASLEQRLGT